MKATAAALGLSLVVLCLSAAQTSRRSAGKAQPPASVCGHWVVKRVLRTTNVQVSPRSLSKFIGVKAEYLPSKMRFGRDVVPHPLYKVSRLSDLEFLRQNTIALTELGIRAKSVVVVDVQDSTGRDVVRSGTELFVKSRKEIIATWDGGYFELARTDAGCLQ